MPPDHPQIFEFGPFRLDRSGRRLTRAGVEIPLGGRAFDVLCMLAGSGGEPVSKNKLLDHVWPGVTVEENNLQVQISALRKALGDGTIVTVPGRGYQLIMAPSNHLPTMDAAAGKPSIAVLPFANLSGDIEQEYFADGIGDDIITALSRIRSFFVIARNSSFAYKGRVVDVRKVAGELGVRYVLEGSVRRGADRLRVTTQLVDAETGNHLWADRHDRPLRDLFDLQDEIATAVTNAIKPTIADAELRRALRKTPGSIGAWETYQRGLWHLLSHNADGLPPAREMFARAIAIDHTLAAAHTALAWLCWIESAAFGLSPFEDGIRVAAQNARAAVAADPNDADAHAVLALLLFAGGDLQAALGHVEQALAISPSCAMAYFAQGSHLLFGKQLLLARENLLIADQLDPRGLNNIAAVRVQIAMSYYFEQNYEKALELVRSVLADNPTNPLAYRWVAACLGQLGRTEEAHDALNTAMTRRRDSFHHYTRRRPPWFLPDDFEHMLDGLRKAGWQDPEAPITGNS